ncbi:MAG TPA: response regulator [Chitinophagaceae bacterium]|jgi:CheY-like chemotaxis protein|nr:response regulator [Chitinophagaceae bacterium]
MNKTILCVDDDEDDLFLLRDSIESMDTTYTIVEASDGVHALDVLHQMKERNVFPCLVVLDINMPRMDGKQTLTHIKKDKQLKEIPLIVFTTSSNPLDKLYCAHYGVELVTKPYDIKSTESIVKRLLKSCV